VKLLHLEDPRWLEFAQSQPKATLFHHPAWARLLADCYGYRAMALALTDGGGAVTAGVPVMDVTRPLGARRWISLPFTDYCPALAGDHAADLVAGLVEMARSSRLRLLELRGGLPPHGDLHASAAFVRHELAVSGDPRLTWDRLFKNHRRNVRIAERAGVRISRGDSASDIEMFYRLHLQTRRRLGVPIQPRRFFRLLLERIVRPGLGFVLSAYQGDVLVAAAIFGAWNGTLIYKYSARDERYAKLDANYLLLWTAIRWACENGYHTFDLGRSDVDQPLLRGFKDGWGAREEPLAYSRIAKAPVVLSSRRLQNAMSLVIRKSDPWVCRVVGELLYKYAT
jgi:CelD/BcsL family acetyltransferase involved in cellulose biosynthesis